MVWFSEEVISPKMIFGHYLERLKQEDYDKLPKVMETDKKEDSNENSNKLDPTRFIRERCVQTVEFLFKGDDSFSERAINYASRMPHVMDFTVIRVT